MQHEFRHPGGPGGEEHPFGGARVATRDVAARQIRADIETRWDIRTGGQRPLTEDTSVRLGVADHRRHMLGCEVGRAEHHASRDTVELDQGECGSELILREQHDAPVAQLLEPAAETGGVRELSE